jgi:LmbE family N-acetylglucosaminyl deacetylase
MSSKEPRQLLASDLLRNICFSNDPISTIVVAAHPDDEAIGLAYRLFSLHPVRIIHLTNGAPYNLHDALSRGFPTREEYACARRMELEQALSMLELPPGTSSGTWFADQTARWHVQTAAELLAQCFVDMQPVAGHHNYSSVRGRPS